MWIVVSFSKEVAPFLVGLLINHGRFLGFLPELLNPEDLAALQECTSVLVQALNFVKCPLVSMTNPPLTVE